MSTENGLKELIESGLELSDLKAILNETQSFALVISGTMVEFLKVRKFLKDEDVYVAYQRVSPRHLYITDEKPEVEA